MLFARSRDMRLPTPEEAPPGRSAPAYEVPERHTVLGTALQGPYPEGCDIADFALGCFWGAERRFWQTTGVWTTLTGFQGGLTPHPVDDEVRTGLTGHAETVRVVFDPAKVSYHRLLRVFWEGHDPTQGFRQGNDVGTQYRSAIYWRTPEQRDAAVATRDAYAAALAERGMGPITTEIAEAGTYYPAEDYHQQYLHKNPAGYCGIGGTGVSCPIGTGVTAA
jgi:peptide-methionine (S)-S-oxide reductase